MIIIYITCKNKAEARKIAKHLLNKGLIVCANLFPIESLYLWKKTLQSQKEYVLILKTEKNKYKQIQKEIKALHSYKTPCIIKLAVTANKEYQQWIKQTINN